MAVHYRPVLQARQAELDALAEVSAATWRRMTPILELAPGERESWTRAGTAFRDRLVDSYRPGMRFGVDLATGLARPAERLAEVLQLAREVVRDALPVLGPADAGAVTRLGLRPAELMLRLRPSDLRLPAGQLASTVGDLLLAAGSYRDAADLLVDLGPLPARRLPDRLRAAVLRVLHESGWRSRTLLSGAFPRTLPRVAEQWQLVEIPRRDELLWRRVRAEFRLASELDYGDYAAAHPVPSSGGRAAPHLRYAVEGRWLVVRGQRFEPQEFFEVCRRVGAHPEFTGRLGAADEQIARRGREGPRGALGCGNSTTWKELSTAHHLEFVVRQLDR